MKLNYQTYFDNVSESDAALSPVIIIPGLFGSIANWRGFADKLSKHVKVVVVDQRNHGKSPHAPENSYFDLASDIVELLDDLNIEKASICGHSMGGKTAMVLALVAPQRVDRLLVLDIAPVSYTHSHAPILEGLSNVDLKNSKSRSDVERQLSSAVPDKSTRMFIMLSLGGKIGSYFWRLNVPALQKNLPLIGGFPINLLADRKYLSKCVFIKGDLSNYVDSEYYDAIRGFFPSAEIQEVSGAGHWLHVDEPAAVLDLCLGFLQKE